VSDLLQGFMLCVQPRKVVLWLVIDPCVNFGRVYCDLVGIYILFLNFLRHQTMDKVQKYNSFNTSLSVVEWSDQQVYDQYAAQTGKRRNS
jgi:hypothetical protein